MKNAPLKSGNPTKQTRSLKKLDQWKLEDAKARLSEVVRLAEAKGPQLVTVRGREAVVVMSAIDFQRLQPKRSDSVPLVHFLRGLDLPDLGEREVDRGRDIEL